MKRSRSVMVAALVFFATQLPANGKDCPSVEDPAVALVITVTDTTGNTNINPTVSVEADGVPGQVRCDFRVTASSCIDWLATPATTGTFIVHASAPGLVASYTSVEVGVDEIGRLAPQWVRITLSGE